MKKLLTILLLGAIVTFSVYAQVNVGGYAKSYWIPYRLTVFEDQDTAHTTAVQTPWGEPDLSAGINVDAWSEWGGFHLGVGIAGGAGNRGSASPFTATGGGWVWVKPLGFTDLVGLDTFTIWLGNPNHSELQGKIGGSDLATYVLNNSYAINRIQGNNNQRSFRLEKQNPEYNTFTRFNPYSWGNSNQDYDQKSAESWDDMRGQPQNLWWPRVAAAAMITWEPIEHLFIGFFVAPEILQLYDWNEDSAGVNNPKLHPINTPQLGDDDINQDFFDVRRVYRNIQVGAGYTIQGIGFARLQWIGLRNVVEGAFQLTALGDLIFDIGFKIPFESNDKDNKYGHYGYEYKKRRDFGASVAATYRNYDFRFTGRIDTAFAASDSSRVGLPVRQRGLNMIVYLTPSYQLGVGTVGLDLGFEYEQKDDMNLWEKDSMQAGLGLWFHRTMGSAQFKTGLVSRLPLEWDGMKQPFDLFFPIILEVGF